MQEELLPGYTFERVGNSTLGEVYQALEEKVYGAASSPNKEILYNDADRFKLEVLGANMEHVYRQNLVVYYQGEPIGWIWGRQTDFETFTIMNAGLLPDYKGKGVYAALFAKNVQLLEQEGFQVIRAYHGIGHSASMMVKLKQGFLIDGMEYSERFGPLIKLCYFTDPQRKAAYIERTTRNYPF